MLRTTRFRVRAGLIALALLLIMFCFVGTYAPFSSCWDYIFILLYRTFPM